MVDFSKDIGQVSATPFIQTAQADQTAANLIKIGGKLTRDAIVGQQQASLETQLLESEDLAAQEQQQILEAKFDNPFDDANAKAIREFQNELNRANELSVSKDQAELRSKTILKKFKSRLPGLSAEFDQVASGLTSSGLTRATVEAASKNQEMLLKKRIESLKTLATQNDLVFSDDPATLNKLFSILAKKQQVADQEQALKVKQNLGSLREEDERQFMPTMVASTAVGLSGLLGQSLGGVSVTSQEFLDRVSRDENLRRSALLSMDNDFNRLKAGMRAQFAQLPTGEFDLNMKAIEDQFTLIREVVSGDREKADVTRFNELAEATNREQIYQSPKLSMGITLARLVPGLVDDLKFKAQLLPGAFDMLARMTNNDLGDPLKTSLDTDPAAAKDENKAVVGMVTRIAKEFAALEDTDSEAGQAMGFAIERVLFQLAEDSNVTANAYTGLFEAAARDPEGWRNIVGTINPTLLPKFNEASQKFMFEKLIPSVNKAAAALKNRPFFGEAEAEMVQFSLDNNVLNFVPENPRNPEHVKKAKEFNQKYGKPFNLNIKALSNVVGEDAVNAQIEEAKFSLDLKNAQLEGTKSGLLTVSQTKAVKRQRADRVIQKFTDNPGTLEQLLQAEEDTPTVTEDPKWESLKQEAADTGRIGNISSVNELLKFLRTDQQQTEDPTEEGQQ